MCAVGCPHLNKVATKKSDQAVIVYMVEGVSGRVNSECKVNKSVYAVGGKYGKYEYLLAPS